MYHRYSQFHALHGQLRDALPGVNLPKIPGKKLLGSSLLPGFVNKRRQALNSYMQALIRIPAVWQSNHLISFLDSPDLVLAREVEVYRLLDNTVRVVGRVASLQKHNT